MATTEMAAERARSAALRLKHDLGKGIRFRAPQEPEADLSALRERLSRDLLATRETPEEKLSAPQVLARWRRDEEPALAGAGVGAELAEISAAVARIGELLPRLDALGREGLLELDALARKVGTLSTAVFARVTGGGA
jgi:hypothetical protein